ncbi:MAG: hypothetical protein ACK58L_19485 [Planctomycetota bacterium]
MIRMTGTVLERSLMNVAARIQKLRILRKQTLIWLVLLIPAIALTMMMPARGGLLRPEFLVLLTTTIVGSLLARLLVQQPTVSEAARLIERVHPELNDAVITAVQVSEQVARKPSVLAAMAVQEADSLARKKDWSGTVSSRQISAWTVLSFLSFAVMVSSVMAAGKFNRNDVPSSVSDAVAKADRPEKEQRTELTIEPGDTELERGSALTVVAKFPGIVPTHAALEYTDSQQNVRQMAMTETVDTGVFAARMEDIVADGTYRVLYDHSSDKENAPSKKGGGKSYDVSQSFKVTTFVRPNLERVDAIITPPAWLRLPSETIEDVVRVSVTEGSTVNFRLMLNKMVVRAELRPKEGPAIVLTPAAVQPPETDPASAKPEVEATSKIGAIFETTILAMESNSWTVYLEDAQGRTAADEEQIAIRVTPNEPPKLKVTFPGRDTNVSALQEFQIEATAADDFELIDYGVQFSVSGAEPQEFSVKPAADQPRTESTAAVVESKPVAETEATPATTITEPIRNATISHTIALETLNAAPDDMVTYSFWATDMDVDGNPRRVDSDLMFAEVRRFEEIMREAQQQGQQQQQNQQQQGPQQQQQGSPIDGLLNLQKEILSATWNTIRTEQQRKKDESFAADVAVIAQSQAQGIEQLTEATAEAASDPKVAALAQRTAEEMAAAQKKLEEVAAGAEKARLSQAVPMEQAILQTLLRMRAAESNVLQQQQNGGGGGGGGGGGASQQQLDQLELDNSRNRYQSEQQAQPQREMTQQQREQLQVLNRLKELARRQQMVNERLKQLESELRAALTEKEKEEIERELKRLREEQREMLRDVDELSERMDQATDPQNAQTSELKEQLQKARENVQQASRAMDDGKLSEAISEGTRAERQFEDLKEDFRNQTSSQFEDAVKDLRQQARELSEKQEQLARGLAGEPTEGEQKARPSLKSDRNREDVRQQASEQKDRLNRVVEQTKQLIEQAEQTEPLLSNTLYETIRQMKDSRPEEALEAAEMLAGRGMWQQSQQAEQVAREGIEQLKSGIEKAADSVLGSEAESLRRAQQQLDEATRKLAGEVASATGEDPLNRDGKDGRDGEQSSGQGNGKGRSAQDGDQKSSDPNQRGRNRSGQAGSEDQKSGRERDPQGRGQSDESEKEGEQKSGLKSGDGRKQSGEESAQSGAGGQQKGDKQGRGDKEGKQRGGSGGGERQDDANQPAEQSEQDADQKIGEQDGRSEGQQNGGQQKGGQQDGSRSGGNSDGQNTDGQPSDMNEPNESERESDSSERSGDRNGQPKGGNQRESGLRNGGREDRGGNSEGMGRGGFDLGSRPLTGDDYTEWSDQLRDIEEMLEDPDLRNRVAQVRDRARTMRAEYKRHGEMPQWDLVKSQLLGEMQLLQQRINQEVSKLQSDRAMVPIDREAVPEEFDSLVQRYYELLGQEKSDDEEPGR